jgi:hypothetical protein
MHQDGEKIFRCSEQIIVGFGLFQYHLCWLSTPFAINQINWHRFAVPEARRFETPYRSFCRAPAVEAVPQAALEL